MQQRNEFAVRIKAIKEAGEPLIYFDEVSVSLLLIYLLDFFQSVESSAKSLGRPTRSSSTMI